MPLVVFWRSVALSVDCPMSVSVVLNPRAEAPMTSDVATVATMASVMDAIPASLRRL
ncbi:hypothetical protein SynMINOS11_00607 [Synechococcus sp. Minos11]|nr:hypothetical protein SynMINOS11_00607 [Synechococcus sp. Minos11]